MIKKILFLTTFYFLTINLAVAQENASEIQNFYLSVNNALLGFEGDVSILNKVIFDNDNFSVELPPGSSFTVTSKDKLDFRVSPAAYVRIFCGDNSSSATISTPINSLPVLISISPISTPCGETLTETIAKTISGLRANPAVTKAIREVIVPASLTVTALSAGTLTVTASLGSANFAFNLTQFLQELSILRFYALGFIRFRRKKPWGRILNSSTGKPITGVLVQIYEAEFKKIKDAQTTDNEGRFSAIVTPGKYFIKASRNGFETKETEIFSIRTPDQILGLEISLSSLEQTPSPKNIQRIKIVNLVRKILEAINPYLLVLGTAIGLAAVIIIPNILNYAGFAVYLILDILKTYFSLTFAKPYGTISDSAGKPLALVVVRVFDDKKNILLSTRVTDVAGRFNFLLSPGKYYLTCFKSGFSPLKSDVFSLSRAGIATLNIKLHLA
mgnify:CR=1 FL=1